MREDGVTCNAPDALKPVARRGTPPPPASPPKALSGSVSAQAAGPGNRIDRWLRRSALATCEPSKRREFLRIQHGGVAIESALSIAVLVVMLGGLMAIAHAGYTDDRMGRAARSAARAVALVADDSMSQSTLGAVACNAIRRELGLDAAFDCDSAWTITISTTLTPAALADGSNADGGDGDMVLVEIGWLQVAPWERAVGLVEDDRARSAMGLARRETAG